MLKLQPAAFHEVFFLNFETRFYIVPAASLRETQQLLPGPFLQKHPSVLHRVSDAITPVYAAMLWQSHKFWETTAYCQSSS